METLLEFVVKSKLHKTPLNIVKEVNRLCKSKILSPDGIAVITIPGDYRYDITIEKITDYNDNVIKDLSEINDKLLSVENDLQLKQLRFYCNQHIKYDKIQEIKKYIKTINNTLVPMYNNHDNLIFVNCDDIKELISVLSNIDKLS